MSVRKIAPNMDRAHVAAMMGPQGLGYAVALEVLKQRDALPEHFVYLNQLRMQQLIDERRAATRDDDLEAAA